MHEELEYRIRVILSRWNNGKISSESLPAAWCNLKEWRCWIRTIAASWQLNKILSGIKLTPGFRMRNESHESFRARSPSIVRDCLHFRVTAMWLSPSLKFLCVYKLQKQCQRYLTHNIVHTHRIPIPDKKARSINLEPILIERWSMESSIGTDRLDRSFSGSLTWACRKAKCDSHLARRPMMIC